MGKLLVKLRFYCLLSLFFVFMFTLSCNLALSHQVIRVFSLNVVIAQIMLSKVFRFSQCIAIVWSCQVRDGESSFIPGACRSCDDAVRTTKYYFQQATPSRINRLLLPVKSSPFPWERSLPDNGENEETLLRIHLSVQPDVEIDLALEKVQRFTQSFPFAAVLPVQPLQYLPTHDGGVDGKKF